jgi:hypothetical protein
MVLLPDIFSRIRLFSINDTTIICSAISPSYREYFIDDKEKKKYSRVITNLLNFSSILYTHTLLTIHVPLYVHRKTALATPLATPTHTLLTIHVPLYVHRRASQYSCCRNRSTCHLHRPRKTQRCRSSISRWSSREKERKEEGKEEGERERMRERGGGGERGAYNLPPPVVNKSLLLFTCMVTGPGRGPDGAACHRGRQGH